MTKSVCTHCAFELEGTHKFCPSCGEKFSGEATTTRMIETRDGPVMIVDKKMLTEAKITGKRGTPEYAKQAIKTKGSGAYQPPDSVLYQTTDNKIVSHTQVTFAKEEKPETAPTQAKDYRPESSVIVADQHDNIVIEKVSKNKRTATTESTKNRSQKAKTKYAELKELIQEEDGVKEVIKEKPLVAPIKPKDDKPKMKDIAAMEGLSIEARMLIMKDNGYADTAILRWYKSKV